MDEARLLGRRRREAEPLHGESLDPSRRSGLRELRREGGVLGAQPGALATEAVDLHVQAEDRNVQRDDPRKQRRNDADPHDPTGNAPFRTRRGGDACPWTRYTFPFPSAPRRRLQFVGTDSSPGFKCHDSIDSQHPTPWLLGYANCFLPAFLAAAHLFFIAKASRFRPAGLITPRRGAAARFDVVPAPSARFAAQRFLAAAMILLRPSGLRCLLRGWPLLLRVVTFAKGLFPATSRRADMARSMADRCVSS